jgi:hypothetical protein
MDYDEMVLGVGNSLHPANEVTVLDDAVEQMSELEFAEWERNLYQKRYFDLVTKLKEIQFLCEGMDENGLSILILNKIQQWKN